MLMCLNTDVFFFLRIGTFLEGAPKEIPKFFFLFITLSKGLKKVFFFHTFNTNFDFSDAIPLFDVAKVFQNYC